MKFRLSVNILVLFLMLSCSSSQKNNITGSGVLEGTEVIVSSKINGQIMALKTIEGDEVQQGDVLAQIDVEKFEIQKEQISAGLAEVEFHIKNAKQGVTQAEENFQIIKKQYNRIKTLYEKGSATQQQMDEIDIKYKAAQTGLKNAQNTLQAAKMKKRQIEANLKLIESQIKDGIITSPTSGVIVDKFLERGEMIGAGMPLVAIADLSNLWIKLYVQETQLGFVKLGAEAEIIIDSYPDKKFPGKVIWISPKAEFTPKNVQTKQARADLVYAVKISVPNPNRILKIGMPADIVLNTKR